jgi:hypothetical protein
VVEKIEPLGHDEAGKVTQAMALLVEALLAQSPDLRPGRTQEINVEGVLSVQGMHLQVGLTFVAIRHEEEPSPEELHPGVYGP